MQSLATAMARKARVRGLWAWSHLDNLLFAHADFSFLERQTTLFVQDLTRCGFRINPADSQFTPTPTIIFGGFFLNGPNECMAHTPSRYRDLLRTLEALKVPQTTKSMNGWRAFGPFYFSLYGSYYHVLRPLHTATATGRPPSLEWVKLFSFVLATLPATMPFALTPITQEKFSDASSTGLGVCLPEGNLVIITSIPRKIFHRELWAVFMAILVSPPQTIIRRNNQAVAHAVTRGHGHTFSTCETFVFTILLTN